MTLLLPFMLGEERYALKLTEVQEVIEDAEQHYLPAAPEVFLAAVNVHGRILPVLDLPKLLGFPAAPQSERMIVLVEHDFPLVLAVNQLEPLLSVDLESVSLIRNDAPNDCIVGVLNWQGQMISLLDLEQLKKRIEKECSTPGGSHATARTDR